MGMEDETRVFLVKIVQTISEVLLWMMVNVYAGIYHELAFFDGRPGWKNIIYYVLFLATLVFLIWHIRRKWKGWFEQNEL